MSDLLRYQAAHKISNLCIGDVPAKFSYRGHDFTVTREQHSYTLEAGVERARVNWRKAAADMVEVVMKAIDALADKLSVPTKQCSKCGRTLPLTEYGTTSDRTKRKYPRADCKACHSLSKSASYQKRKRATRKARTAYMRVWREQNAEHVYLYDKMRHIRRAHEMDAA